MGRLKWYKRDPDAALVGMRGLTLEERGAYNTVLDLIYSCGDALPDDERFLCGWLGCDLRVWKRIKVRLVELRKIQIIDGQIRNGRATSEILVAMDRGNSRQEAGRINGIKSGFVRRKNKDLDEPDLEGKTNTTTTTTRIGTYVPIETTHQTYLDQWNVLDSIGIPRVQVLDVDRTKKLVMRLAELGGPDGWQAMIAKIRASPKCGEWISFDWILNSANLRKLMEGNYDARPTGAAANSISRAQDDLRERLREGGFDPRHSSSDRFDDGTPAKRRL